MPDTPNNTTPDPKSGSKNGTSATPSFGDDSSPMKTPQTTLGEAGKDKGSASVDAPGQSASSAFPSAQRGAATSGMSSSPTASAFGSAGGADTSHAAKANSAMSDAADQAKGAASSASTAASEATQGVVSDAQEEAKDLKDKSVHLGRQAADAAKSGLSEVADQAKTAASSVAAAASAASEKVQDLFADATDEFEDVIEERKAQGAQQLHRLAGAIDRAGSEIQEEFPLVAGLVKRGASRVDTLAETIRERPGRTLAAEAGDVVRRRPGAVAGVLGLVGFAALRFLKATPPHSGSRDWNRGTGEGGGTNEDVQRSLLRSTATGEGLGSGDPGGTSPEAPGFETRSDTGGATRRPS